MRKIGITTGTIFTLSIFILTAFIPSGTCEANTMESWIQNHTVRVNATTIYKYEQGYLLINETYTGEVLKERFGVEKITKEFKTPEEKVVVDVKVLGMQEGEEKVVVTEKVTVLTSGDDPPHWWDNYKYPQWAWDYIVIGDIYEKRDPINLVWKKTTKDTVKSEIFEEEWYDYGTWWYFYVYDPVYGWIKDDNLADAPFGTSGRYHIRIWGMSDGDIVANAHHDCKPDPWHEADQLEVAEKYVASFFREPEDTEWSVYWDSYDLENEVTDPFSNGWCSRIIYGRDNTSPTVDDFFVLQDSLPLGKSFIMTYIVSDAGGSGLKQVELWRNSTTEEWNEILPKRKLLKGDGPKSGGFLDSPASIGTYWYGIHVVDNADNLGLEPNPPGPIKVEVTLANQQPTASASDITGQPTTMYPNTIYSISADYYDQNGRDDLKLCYLRLNHPSKPLTMGWVEATGNYWPYAGEEGANYLTITSVTSTPLTNGYRLTWHFKINENWPETSNSIDFGVFARDDDNLFSGWHYDNTDASFVANQYPYQPSNPSPSDYATDRSIHTDLSWTGGDPDPGDTVTYDVHFGTSSNPPSVSNDQSGMTYDPGTLSYNTKYYWKIIATDNHGASTPGPLWDFTTGSAPNNAPYTPSNPSPSNHASGQSIYTDVSWSGGDPDAGDTVTYDVHFGTSSNPPPVSNDQSGMTYDPGTLSYNTKYYWKIIATDNHGASTPGPLWDFTTTAPSLTVTPQSQNLGNVQVDQCSQPYSFTLQNTGGETAIGTVSLTGTDADQFTITGGEGSFSLGPGDTKTIIVKFCPDSEGVKSTTLYATGSNCNDASSSLSGTGVLPPQIWLFQYGTFLDVHVGQCSFPQSFTLWSTGGATATGTVSITGDDADLFTITSGGGDFSLDPGDTKTINVKFCPDSEGVWSATLNATGSNCDDVSSSLMGVAIINNSLTISSTAGGKVTEPGEGIFTFKPGTRVDIIAISDSGHQFVNWTGDVSTINPNNPSTSIWMDNNYTITANFEKIPPSPYWARGYRITDVGSAHSIQQTSDGGYIVAGTEVESYYEKGEDFWVVKFDSNGDIQWEKTYGGTKEDYAWAVQQTSDSGYIVAGYTASFGPSADFWVLKLNSTGNIEWQKTYGGNGFDGCYSGSNIKQTLDDGYILAGYSDSFGESMDFWVLKLSSTGTVQWQKTYGGDYSDQAFSVHQTSDEGYIVAGKTISFEDGNGGVWILKLDSSGVVQWQKTYGDITGPDCAWDIQQTLDGGYIMVGEYSVGAGDYDLWALKLDNNGNITWGKAYGGADLDRAWAVQQTSDGGYIIAGRTDSYGAGRADFWLLKLDSNGNITWERTFGGTDSDYAYSVNQTSDGYVVAGYAGSLYSQGGFCILKLDPYGSIPPYCPLMNDSKATITTTEVTVKDTSISGVDTSITPNATYITPVDNHANVFQRTLINFSF